MSTQKLTEDEVSLLLRTARAIISGGGGDRNEAARFLECAAAAGDSEAQFLLGLWLARMDAFGGNRNDGAELANYKEAIRWLGCAGEQGIASAWYVISRIYLKPQFSQRSVDEAYRYLRKAAEEQHLGAQRDLGAYLWRSRRQERGRDVRALYWLQRAAALGCEQSAVLLERHADKSQPAPWALEAQHQLQAGRRTVPAELMARIGLAARIGLSIPEALLIDMGKADHGHCLEIDIRGQFARGKRRLILIDGERDREAVEAFRSAMTDAMCNPSGFGGSYRQRLSRLQKSMTRWQQVRSAATCE